MKLLKSLMLIPPPPNTSVKHSNECMLSLYNMSGGGVCGYPSKSILCCVLIHCCLCGCILILHVPSLFTASLQLRKAAQSGIFSLLREGTLNGDFHPSCSFVARHCKHVIEKGGLESTALHILGMLKDCLANFPSQVRQYIASLFLHFEYFILLTVLI